MYTEACLLIRDMTILRSAPWALAYISSFTFTSSFFTYFAASTSINRRYTRRHLHVVPGGFKRQPPSPSHLPITASCLLRVKIRDTNKKKTM